MLRDIGTEENAMWLATRATRENTSASPPHRGLTIVSDAAVVGADRELAPVARIGSLATQPAARLGAGLYRLLLELRVLHGSSV